MPAQSYDKEVLKRLDAIKEEISHDTLRAFLTDLRDAIGAQSRLTTMERAPYVNPVILGEVRPEVVFPGYGQYNSPAFSFLVRPLEGERASTAEFYGVPMWLDGVVSYEESKIGERKISTLRVGSGINPATDRLIGILREQRGEEFHRANQDLLMDTVTIADLLAAYQTEDGSNFKGIQVQRVKAVIPTNPAYHTEAVGFVANHSYSPQEQVCFGYGVGETFYRGRPIIRAPDRGPRLTDINERGDEAFFNVSALSALRREDYLADVKVGNLVIIALPLVGPEPRASPIPTLDLDSRGLDFTLGGGTRGRGGTFGMKSMDLAALTTGRATGTKSTLIPGKFDPTRPVSILDVQLLALTPDKIEDALKGLPE